MNGIPVFSSDSELCSQIDEILREVWETHAVPVDQTDSALEALAIDLPELVILCIPDDQVDGMHLLDQVSSDPWLLQSGIIVIGDELDREQAANVLISISPAQIDWQLPRILKVIRANSKFLFQRQIGADVQNNLSGSFLLENDPNQCVCFAGLVGNFLYNANWISREKRDELKIALMELLLNAVEHGNCRITYAEKSSWIDEGNDIAALIRERLQDPEIAERKVLFEYTINPTQARFTIADEGNGFDWQSIIDPRSEENLSRLHGRGILLTRSSVENLTYNERGNEVRFEISYEDGNGELTPRLFNESAARDVSVGDVIFRQGEEGDFLYYIAKGEFDVIVNDEHISSFSSEDVFMGEMSFLRGSHRTATVVATSPGRLIELSRREFVHAIRKKPHYAMFLCRLLAQRLDQVSRSAADRGPA